MSPVEANALVFSAIADPEEIRHGTRRVPRDVNTFNRDTSHLKRLHVLQLDIQVKHLVKIHLILGRPGEFGSFGQDESIVFSHGRLRPGQFENGPGASEMISRDCEV